MKTFQELLTQLDACQPACKWAKRMTIEKFVEKCPNGEWLFWLALEMNLPTKQLILAGARCAETVIHLMTDPRSIEFVILAKKFSLTDEVSEDDFTEATCAAYDAARVCYTTAAAHYAASAARVAAYYDGNAVQHTVRFAARAAYSAFAARAAYSATRAAASHINPKVAEIENQLQTAAICRELLGKELIKAVNARLK